MSAGSSRPPVPRPSPRASSAPPPAPASATKPSDPPSSPVIEIPKAYAEKPPVIRDRLPSTMELADDDVVEEAPLALVRRSTPPPPPPSKKKVLVDTTPVLVVPQPISLTAPRITPLPVPKFDLADMLAAEIEPPPESRIEVKPIVKAPARVESTLDPMDVLFDGVYELNFVDTAVEAADVCAGALAKALRARAVVIHAHDLVRRELRAIGVHGASFTDVFGSKSKAEDDLVASAVLCNEAPVTMRWDGELPRLAPPRFGVVGAPRTVVAVPAMAWGRCVAMIEVIDADDRVAHRVADSAAYVAERLAEFLSERAAA